MELDVIFGSESNTAQVIVNGVPVFDMNKSNGLWWAGGEVGFKDAWDAARDKIASLRVFNYLISKKDGDAIA